MKEERHRRSGTGGDVWPLVQICIHSTLWGSMRLYGALWGSMGLCRALWGSTVGLINPGHDLVTNSTHLSPASRPSPDMVRACIDLMKYNFCLFLACFQFQQSLENGSLRCGGVPIYEKRAMVYHDHMVRDMQALHSLLV